MLRVAIFLMAGVSLAAQQPAPVARISAVRTATPPRVDGRLDEAAWASATALRGFLQREPAEGQPAPEDTEIRFLYTDDALYIGARMFSGAPASLRTLVARRDTDVPSEQLLLSFDTHQNHTTAYSFGITPGGVRTDYFHPSDNEGSRDYSFDPVWEAATQVDADGWTAEVRIPFSQLRFNAADELRWGLNAIRRVPQRNEETMWVLVPRNQQGWSSRMGTLDGLRDLAPPRRAEIAPYFAAEGVRSGTVDPGDPFASRTAVAWRAGADLKLGLSSALTLDATINPDFGQVEADPAVVNLSAFETFFAERRPFFTEGASLFGGRSTFYSRRIGSAPPIGSGAEYAEQVGNTTILGAGKVTGRSAGGFSLGALGAVTAQERVRTYDPVSDTFGEATIAPYAGYGIVTGQQEFGRDRSTIRASFTAVERQLDAGTPLAAVLARRAWTGLVDGRWRWAGGRYDISSFLVVSRVEGEPAAMLRLQQSSARYYQRPDADHVTLDPSRTTLAGATAGVNHSKIGGNWLWDVDYTYYSPGLELNDLGILGQADLHDLQANVRYRRTRPGPLFHNWYLGVFGNGGFNGGGVRTRSNTGFFTGVTLKNFWTADAEVVVITRALDDRLTRGGPLMTRPRGMEGTLILGNARGARTRWTLQGYGFDNEVGSWERSVSASIALQPSARWTVSIAPRIFRWRTTRQYVATRDGGPAETFGSRYIFATVDRHQVSAQIRTSFAVTPDLTVEGYVEPFASSGDFSAFGALTAARTTELTPYPSDTDAIAELGDPDFNIRSFRSNLVVRWEWRAGSTAYLVWQQSRFDSRSPGTAGLRGIGEAFGAPGDQFVALKINYWLSAR